MLTTAGYSSTSPDGRITSSHPLFTRTGQGRYALIRPPARTGHSSSRSSSTDTPLTPTHPRETVQRSAARDAGRHATPPDGTPGYHQNRQPSTPNRYTA